MPFTEYCDQFPIKLIGKLSIYLFVFINTYAYIMTEKLEVHEYVIHC